MSTKTSPNGQERKTLASQLDRLDAILDALGVGLNEAVATAVQDLVGTAVTAAVQAAVVEVLTSPELLQRLRPAAQPEPAPSLFGRLARKARSLCGWLAGMAKAAWHRAVGVVKGVALKTAGAVAGRVGAARSRVVNVYWRARALFRGVL